MLRHLDHVEAGLRSAIDAHGGARDGGRRHPMNIRGSRTLDAPRDAVFAAICDPNTLLGGHPRLQRDRAGRRRRVPRPDLAAAAGHRRDVPDGRPAGRDRRAELRSARRRGRRARSARSRGSASFRLTGDGGRTTVDYDGQAVDRRAAGADSTRRFVEGLAGSLINQGLGDLDARLQRDAVGRHRGRTTAGDQGDRA